MFSPTSEQTHSRNEASLPTFLLVDLHSYVHVDADDDKIADDVKSADTQEYVRVIEGYLLAGLHHHQDDDQVGSAHCQ